MGRMTAGLQEERICSKAASGRPSRTRADKQILVAGIGNAWLATTASAARSPSGLERDASGRGEALDFGSGGLDLAYEVMRGYDALLLIDVSKQGGEPGTLYVIEPDPAEIAGGIEDGEVINPHGMDPATVLRFVKAVDGWPGKVVVVACEPADVEEMAMELTPEVRGGRPRTRSTWCSSSCRAPAKRRGLPAGRCLMHELSLSSAIIDTVLRHAEGRRVSSVEMPIGRLRQVVPDSLDLLLRDRLAGHARRGRDSSSWRWWPG